MRLPLLTLQKMLTTRVVDLLAMYRRLKFLIKERRKFEHCKCKFPNVDADEYQLAVHIQSSNFEHLQV
jgi:hypothetical protein